MTGQASLCSAGTAARQQNPRELCCCCCTPAGGPACASLDPLRVSNHACTRALPPLQVLHPNGGYVVNG